MSHCAGYLRQACASVWFKKPAADMSSIYNVMGMAKIRPLNSMTYWQRRGLLSLFWRISKFPGLPAHPLAEVTHFRQAVTAWAIRQVVRQRAVE